MPLLEFFLVGLSAGWVIGKVRNGEKGGYGLVKSLVIGVIGSFIGWFLMGFLGVDGSHLVVRIVMAILGATLFFFVVSLVKGKKKKKSEDEDE
jgi:uncharacterized membrane protein YeaQ/YmgE (transglycosylase-associated protein family)